MKPVLRIEEMLPDEIESLQKAGNDLAIIPIGSLEQHGPHLFLGCDGYIAQAKAQEIARASGGILFPMVNFSWVGATNAFSGGIGVRQSTFIQYLRSVVKGVRESGFRRILIVNGHGGNFYAMRSLPHDLFREEGIVVVTSYGFANCAEARRLCSDEGSALTGALMLLGRNDLVDEALSNCQKAMEEFGEQRLRHRPEMFNELHKAGLHVGLDYEHECLHVYPRAMKPENGKLAILAMARHVAEHLDALGDYVDEVGGTGKMPLKSKKEITGSRKSAKPASRKRRRAR